MLILLYQRTKRERVNRMIVGVDIGFDSVKVVTDGRESKFPSVVGGKVVGSGFRAQNGGIEIELEGKTYLVGEKAQMQSTYQSGRRDPAWVSSNMWRVLLCAALSEVHKGSGDIQLVTGLPLQHYAAYSDKLQNDVKGEYRLRRCGGSWQTFNISHAAVVTQPFGALFNFGLDDSGRIIDNAWTKGTVGIIDAGGNTLNNLASHCLAEIPQWSDGCELGLLKALEQVGSAIRVEHPEISPRTREVTGWIKKGEFPVFDKVFPIQPFLTPFAPVVEAIVGFTSETFKEPGRLSRLGLVGGVAVLLGNELRDAFDGGWPPLTIGNEYSNVNGMLKFGKRLSREIWK